MDEIRKTTSETFQAGKCIRHFRRLEVGEITDTPDWSAARLTCAAACRRINATPDHQRQSASTQFKLGSNRIVVPATF